MSETKIIEVEERVHETYALIIKLIISRQPAKWEGICTKVLRTGFGYKRGEKEKSAFLQRLFILTADQLYYVEPSDLVLKGTINLAQVESVLSSQKCENCLELTSGPRTYYIQFKKGIIEWEQDLIASVNKRRKLRMQ